MHFSERELPLYLPLIHGRKESLANLGIEVRPAFLLYDAAALFTRHGLLINPLARQGVKYIGPAIIPAQTGICSWLMPSGQPAPFHHSLFRSRYPSPD